MEAVEASRSAWAAAAAALEASRAAALKLASTVWLEATTRSTVPLAFWRIPIVLIQAQNRARMPFQSLKRSFYTAIKDNNEIIHVKSICLMNHRSMDSKL